MNCIRNAGYGVWMCGGCVRDLLLRVPEHDIDLCTNAPNIQDIFPQAKPINKNLEVYTVDGYEVARLRIEGEYDGRRPQSVQMTNSLIQDSGRRDFTMNAMYRDEHTIYDFHNGINDTVNAIVRCVGNPHARFKEDYLRMLRAVRFASNLDFEIEGKTFEAIQQNADKIAFISKERIVMELKKLNGHYARFMNILDISGLATYIFPFIHEMKVTEQNRVWHPEGNVWNHTRQVLNAIEGQDFIQFMAALFHDIGKIEVTELDPDTGQWRAHNHDIVGAETTRLFLEDFKLSTDELNTIVGLVKEHMRIKEINNMRIAKRKKLAALPYIDHLMALAVADVNDTRRLPEQFFDFINRADEWAEEAKRPRLINGNDLIAMGLKPGPQFKEILESVHDAELDGEVTTKNEALAYAGKII